MEEIIKLVKDNPNDSDLGRKVRSHIGQPFKDKVDSMSKEETFINFYSEEPIPIMDEFDRTLKVLHESTHDVKIRESLLIVQGYKTLHLDTPKS